MDTDPFNQGDIVIDTWLNNELILIIESYPRAESD